MERRISKQAMFEKICQMVSEKLESVPHIVSSRRLYYVSAEFLIGNMLASNLINLGLYEKAEEMAKEQGYLLQEILDMEQEPSLGNGGLGRLAACYLDSIAALQLPGDGIGLLYHCGLFRQEFCDGKQKELPDFWLHGNQWLKRTKTH